MKVFEDFKRWSDRNQGQIEIITRNGLEIALNKFRPAAPDEKIKYLTDFFSSAFPSDYIAFLQICNGASLFEDLEYGGVNFFYSVSEVIDFNEAPDRKIVVADILDDRIIIDLDRWQSGTSEYLLLSESKYSKEYTGFFYSNFETFLERFVISQGEKFWYWKTDRHIF